MGQRIENTMVLEIASKAYLDGLEQEQLEQIYNSGNFNEAEGDDLDNLLYLFDRRMQADYSITDELFCCDTPAVENIEIPAGTRIRSHVDETIIFTTNQTATLYAGQSTVTIPMTCTTIGSRGNTPRHMLNIIIDEIDGIDYVDNPYGTTGGREVESDDSFKARNRNLRYKMVRGTYDAIVDAITGVSAVEGFYVEQYFRGKGSARVIIDPPTDTVLELVEIALNPATAKAVDEDWQVEGVEEVPLSLHAEANTSIDRAVPLSDAAKDTLSKQIKAYMQVYIEGGYNQNGTPHRRMNIAQDFIPFKACKYISDQLSLIESLELTYPTGPVTIQPNQRASFGSMEVTII